MAHTKKAILTNSDVQNIIATELIETHKASSDELSPVERSLAVARLSRAHVLCTRAQVYGTRLAVQAEHLNVAVPNIEVTLKMPVFKE